MIDTNLTVNQIKNIYEKANNYEIPETLGINDVLNKIQFLEESQKQITNLIATVKQESDISLDISIILEKIKFLKNGLDRHLNQFVPGTIVNLGVYSSKTQSLQAFDKSSPMVEPLAITSKKPGSLDRQLIANSFKSQIESVIFEEQLQEIKKKVEWLKEWLLDSVNGATDQEVIAFLIYCKATSDFDKDQIIGYTKQETDDSTCLKPFPLIENGKLAISGSPCKDGDYNDHDKDNFIKSLKFKLVPHILEHIDQKVEKVELSEHLSAEKIKEHISFFEACQRQILENLQKYWLMKMITKESPQWKTGISIAEKISDKIKACNKILESKVHSIQKVAEPVSSNSSELEEKIKNNYLETYQFRFQVEKDKKGYIVCRNSPYLWDTLNIQSQTEYYKGSQAEKLAIKLNEKGEIEEVWVNGKPQRENSKKVPNNWLTVLVAAAQNLPQINPSNISIKTVRDDVQKLPEKFLLDLDVAIQNSDQKIEVTYLHKDGSKKRDLSRVFSKGGHARDFLDELLTGLTQHSKELSFKKVNEKSSLYIPLSKDKNQLNHDENRLFQALGKLLMFCWESKSVQDNTDDTVLMGCHLDPSLFNMIFTLTSKEVKGNFDEIPEATKLKIIDKFLLTQDERTELKYTFQIVALQSSSQVTLAQIEKYRPDLAKKLRELKFTDDVKDQEKYRQILKDDLYEGLDAEKMLRALHSIAKGMESFIKRVDKDKYWDTELRTTYNLHNIFSDKIQGSQNHQSLPLRLISQIPGRLSKEQYQEFNNKMKWIKEWLTKASSEQVQKFLKYYTGSSSSSPAMNIIFTNSAWDHKPPVLNPRNGNLLISTNPPCSYNEFIKGLEAQISTMK